MGPTRRRPRQRRAPVLVATVVVGLVVAGCAGSRSSSASRTSPHPPEATGRLTVLAAASLTDAFTEIGARFEKANPRVKVTFGFGASSSLATQVNQGAPGDVFASADAPNMDKLLGPGGAGAASPPVTFARNSLQIVVGRGNPKRIASLADLARPGVVYVAAAPSVPIGGYAQQVLAKAAVAPVPKSLEADVKAVVTKVALGEADAGIVYTTDVRAAGDKVQGVAIPDELNVVARYPIAVLRSVKNPVAADAFVAFVRGSEGQAVLASYGFGAP